MFDAVWQGRAAEGCKERGDTAKAMGQENGSLWKYSEYEWGKVVFAKAGEKDVSLTMMQSDDAFGQNRQGCVFKKHLGQGCLQR